MKKLLLIISVFVIILNLYINVYADEIVEESSGYDENGLTVVIPEKTGPSEFTKSDKYYTTNQDADIYAVLNNPDSTDADLLRAILVCVMDIDMYVQFLVTIGFSIGLIYFVILKPIRFFLY